MSLFFVLFLLSLEILVQSENRVSAEWSSNRPHCNGLKSLCGDEPKISRLIVQYVLTSNVSKLWRCSIVYGGSIPNILYIVCFLNALDYHIFNCTRPWFLLCMFFQFYVVVFVFECRSKGLFSSFLFFFLLLRFSSRSGAKYRGSSSFFFFFVLLRFSSSHLGDASAVAKLRARSLSYNRLGRGYEVSRLDKFQEES